MRAYSEYKYSELVLNGYGGKARDNVLSLAQISKQIAGKELFEAYRSHFRFKKDFQDYARKHKSVSGYDGEVYVDYLWVDIDDSDLNKALDTAQVYLHRLAVDYKFPVKYLRCFFSGNKGFHIGIPSVAFGFQPGKDLPLLCKALATSMAGDLGVDLAIYDRTRLLRLSNSKHQVSGRYKVELEPDMLQNCTDIETILRIADSPGNGHREIKTEEVQDILLDVVKNLATQPDNEDAGSRIKPAGATWLTDILENGASSGNRTGSVTRLAGYYKSKEIPEDVALSLITAWDIAKNTPPLTGDSSYSANKIQTTIADIYKYPDKESVEVPTIQYHHWRDLHQQAPEYVEKLHGNRLKFGFPKIDFKSAGLGRGEVAILLAYVGVGKTAWAQTVQLNVSEGQGLSSILFSLEMTAMRLYFRQLSMLWGDTPSLVEQKIKLKADDDYSPRMAPYEHAYIVDYVPMSVPLITDIIKTAPEPIDFALVDYVGLMSTEGDRPYDRMTKLSRDLALMAKELDIALICIYQTNREGRNGEISLAMARDSGMIEANCDIALGMWIDQTAPDQRIIKLLKARHGISGAEHVLSFYGGSPRLQVVDRWEEGDE